MARLNRAFIIDEHQEYLLQDAVNDLQNDCDLNYLGYNRLNPIQKFFVKGKEAHINRVLLWLASKPNDYVRQSLKGGVLYGLLGQKAAEPDLEAWKAEIKTRFNQDFSHDLTLITLELSMNQNIKVLGIKMIVQDNITKAMIPVSTGVSL